MSMFALHRRIRSKRGAFLMEYGLIVGFIVGAVFAMSQYIKNRVAGGIKSYSDAYHDSMNSGVIGGDAEVFNPNTKQQSASQSRTDLDDANTGKVGSRSYSRSEQLFDDIESGAGGP